MNYLAHAFLPREDDDLVLGGQSPDGHAVRADLDAAQGVDILQVHQILRHRHAQLHHWNQAMPAGHHAGLLAQRRLKADRFVQGFRTMIVE